MPLMKNAINAGRQVASSLALALLSLNEIERKETIAELESGIAIALAASGEGKCRQQPSERRNDLVRN